MKKFVKTFSMQKKLTTLFFVCTLIPIVIIFMFAIISLCDDELTEYNISTEKRLNGAVNIMNKSIDEDIMKSETIVRSSIIIDGLQQDYDGDIMSVMMYYRELSEFMASFGVYNESKYVIYPIDGDMPLGQYVGDVADLQNYEEVWKKLNDGSNSVIAWDYSHASEANWSRYISMFRKIYDFEKLLGYFETRIYINDLIYSLQNMSVSEGERISCITPDGVSFYLNEEASETKYDIEYTVLLNGGSTVSSAINKTDVLKRCYKYIVYYLFGFGVLIAVLFFVYKKMISSVTKDLNSFIGLLQANSEISPDDLSDSDSVDPDIALIKRKFCDLLIKIKKMYSDIVEINRSRRVMELELLQSGINPHLLYNSLSVIRWQMIRLHQDELVDMIDNMSEYYRQVLAGGDYVITVREELELVDKYIKINELSYKNKYTVIKNIDEEILDYSTIKLILQPIVENSILHGLVDKEDGIINITITGNGEDIVFKIEDNGYGMSEADIQKALDTKKVQRRKGGYGISNTIKRIKAYYGDECGIEIASEVGKGTMVVIHIKCVEHNELKERFEKGC